MAPASFTEAWVSSADFSNRYKLRTTKQNVDEHRFVKEISKKVDASAVNSKLDFFLSMGLKCSNFCDINCNNNDVYDLQSSCKRISRSSSRISESFDDLSEKSFDSRSKRNNSKICQSREMRYSKIIPLIKECSVAIIGDKCKICGRSFKCIKDVQMHTKKKHRLKKPMKNLVIKIGNEVISRVPIKRKHLKCLHKQKQQTICYDDDAISLSHEEENGFCQMSDEEILPFADADNHCDTRLIENGAILLQNTENESRIEFPKHHKDEDEEIQVLLKITRPRKSMEINHETPNRNERERLFTDAIKEFIRMDDDLIEIIEPNRDLQIYRDDSEIIEEFSRLADNRIQNDNLDDEEHNCSFHIENEDEIDCYGREANSLVEENDHFFVDETASAHSQNYRNENGDIIPDFIDYTHCLNDRTPHNNNDNCVYELESLFYNEARINEWDKASCDPKIVGFDVLQNTSRSFESSALIKEEIMLEDFLL